MNKIILALAVVALAPSLLAFDPPFSAPDGGSSALLLGIAAASVAAARRFLGKRS